MNEPAEAADSASHLLQLRLAELAHTAPPLVAGHARVWLWSHSADAWGHVSLTLSDGTHMSWWPSGGGRHYKLGDHPKMRIFSAPVRQGQTYAWDAALEDDHHADHWWDIPVNQLSEGAIHAWWDNFRANDANVWSSLTCNCSTMVYTALRVGGGPYLQARTAKVVAGWGAMAGIGFVMPLLLVIAPVASLIGITLTHLAVSAVSLTAGVLIDEWQPVDPNDVANYVKRTWCSKTEDEDAPYCEQGMGGVTGTFVWTRIQRV